MKKKNFITISLLILLNFLSIQSVFSQLQILEQSRFGVGGGAAFGVNEAKTQTINFLSGLFYRQPITNLFFADLGVSYTYNSGMTWFGKDYRTRIIPINLSINYIPIIYKNYRPYVFGSFGGIIYKVIEASPAAASDSKQNGFSPLLALGAGVELAVAKNLSLDFHFSGNSVFSDNINGENDNHNDGYLNFALSVVWSMGQRNPDTDGDGLSDDLEKQIGTNPLIQDTDGDGLSDGEEYYTYKTNPLDPDTDGDGLYDGLEVKKFKTDPLKVDTDGDGLSDGNEVLKYHTDPLKFDTDGDGLSDGDEVLKYHTDPLKLDTDGDGLSDGDEVLKYHTDPLKFDTDGDGLSDGDEVLKYHSDPLNSDTDNDGLKDGEEIIKYKTDPLKPDTDGGSVNDGTEIKRGTNPLDPKDDLETKLFDEFETTIGSMFLMDGLEFETGISDILPESQKVLNKILKSLIDNPKIEIEIISHTNDFSSKNKNIFLSQQRAQSVKNWFIDNGISSDRISVTGAGSEKATGDNNSDENRKINSRVEIKRTK